MIESSKKKFKPLHGGDGITGMEWYDRCLWRKLFKKIIILMHIYDRYVHAIIISKTVYDDYGSLRLF